MCFQIPAPSGRPFTKGGSRIDGGAESWAFVIRFCLKPSPACGVSGRRLRAIGSRVRERPNATRLGWGGLGEGARGSCVCVSRGGWPSSGPRLCGGRLFGPPSPLAGEGLGRRRWLDPVLRAVTGPRRSAS
ncbi:hypothetical protein [Lysobacter gummosus]|uniref:hypothetical protein n=1 Tax=Lysobacter gummosus TaxID=262324 RepID=UPI0036349BBA